MDVEPAIITVMTVPVRESALFGAFEGPDYELGAQMAVSVSAGSSWKHRKVESLRLLEGEFGRRRVSLDLTPIGPSLADLGYDADARALPLTMLVKQPLRDFDVSDESGRPLPVLGRSDDGFVAWSILAARYHVDLGTGLSDRVLRALYDLVHLSPDEARKIATSLSAGQVDGEQEFDPSRIDRETEFLTRDFANYFLLIVLLPEDCKHRQVVKYSSHWNASPPAEKQTLWERFEVGLGFKGIPLALDVGGASDAASYHLEIHALPGMLIANLKLPAGTGWSHYRDDREIGVVGHAVESYDGAPGEDAQVVLTVPRGGVRTVALFTTLFTAVTFWLERTLHGAHEALLESNDGAAAVLLIVPAAYSLALSRPSENVVLSHLLWPLRVLTFLCIALLLFGAASLVGVLHSPYTDLLWWGGAVASVLSFVVQLRAWFVSESRDTTW